MTGLNGRALVIDSDRDIAEIVHAVLTDAGFGVSLLVEVRSDAIRVAVGQQEPDCVLLDGEAPPITASPGWIPHGCTPAGARHR